MSIPAWLRRWVQARDEALLYEPGPGVEVPEAVAREQRETLVLRAGPGQRRLWHMRSEPVTGEAVDDLGMENLVYGLSLCEAQYPAERCPCGAYRLVWE